MARRSRAVVRAVEYARFVTSSNRFLPSGARGAAPRAVRLHPTGPHQARGAGDVPDRGKHLGDGPGWRSGSPRRSNALDRLSANCRGRSNRLAYEALVRNEEPTLRSPPDLFEAAERRPHAGSRADGAGPRRRHPGRDPVAGLLFINLHAMELADDSLISPDAPLSRHASRVSWRSPSVHRWSRSATPAAASPSCARSATGSPSTIWGPAMPGSPASPTSSPTWSRSTCRSSAGSIARR